MSDIRPTVFPAMLNWPDAVVDLRVVDKNAENLRLRSDSKGMEVLPTLGSLRQLWCFDVDGKRLSHISQCVHLQRLYIDNLKTTIGMSLSALSRLRVLSIERCGKATSLDEFGKFTSLDCLRIAHFNHVHDLMPLGTLTNLTELAVAGGMWSRMRVTTLSPISRLTKLRYLNLTNLKPDDDSLRPLANLRNLARLDIANFYPMEQIAWLSAQLPNTHCTWSKPYVEMSGISCKKCSRGTKVMLSGRGTRSLCKSCDTAMLEKHVERFNEYVAHAA